MITEPWRVYRGVKIDREQLDERTPGLKAPKWRYYAVCGGYRLVSLSQAGIKTQIGRVMNGLAPCDCEICVCRIPATPISGSQCNRGLDMLAWFGGCSCARFEVRTW